MADTASEPVDERVERLRDVLGRVTRADLVTRWRGTKTRSELITDLARETKLATVICRLIVRACEWLLSPLLKNGDQWLGSGFGRKAARAVVRIPGACTFITWLDRKVQTVEAEQSSGQDKDGPPEARIHLLHRRRHRFVGRTTEREKLKARLAAGSNAAICAVNGMGGVGKTELALQVAGDIGAAFPDGIVTVNLRGAPDSAGAVAPPLEPDAAMREVLAELDPTAKPPDHPTALARAYRQTLVGKHLLLILDNALDTAQVTPLVPPEPVALLVTSRNRIDLNQSLVIDLDILEPDDAMTLIRAELSEDHAIDDATLARFAELCGYLPVALLAIAGTLKTSRTRTPAQLLARLEADRKKGLTEALDRLRPSIDALAGDDPDLARRFARLAVFAGDFTADAAAFIWETDDDTACDGLDTLLARSLLLPATTDAPEPRFRLHDLIRDLARERLGDDAQAAARRHATFYEDLLGRCQTLYRTGNEATLEALALFDRERTEIEAGQRWAAEHSATDVDAARLAADYPHAGIDVIALRLHSRTQIAWLDAALTAYRRVGNRQGEGNALGNLGNAWAMLGEPRKAIDHFEQVLVIAREIGDRRDEGAALGSLGNAYAALGETRKAIDHHEQALVISREIGDRRGEGNALGNLGLAWADLGETRKAIDLYEQHLAIAREIGDRRGQGNTLWNAALAHEKLDETDAALAKAREAYVIRRVIVDPNAPKVAAWLSARGVDPDSL